MAKKIKQDLIVSLKINSSKKFGNIYSDVERYDIRFNELQDEIK